MTTNIKKGLDELDAALDPISDEALEKLSPKMSELLPRGYLSVSQANLFIGCPQAWYLRYVERKPSKGVLRMFEGKNVHAAAEKVANDKMQTGKVPPLDVALDAFSDAFEQSKPLIEDWEERDPGQTKDLGAELTRLYHAEIAPQIAPVGVEQDFTVQIPVPGTNETIPVYGVIDLNEVQLDRPALEYDPEAVKQSKLPRRIRDLKVCTDKWGPNDLPNDLQFMTYAHAMGTPDVTVDQLVKGRAKVPKPRYETASHVMTPRETGHGLAVLAGVAKSIALGHFPMTGPDNWRCTEKWCSMWQYCRGK